MHTLLAKNQGAHRTPFRGVRPRLELEPVCRASGQDTHRPALVQPERESTVSISSSRLGHLRSGLAEDVDDHGRDEEVVGRFSVGADRAEWLECWVCELS